MKRRLYIIALIWAVFVVPGWGQEARKTELLVLNWKFHKGEVPRGESLDLDDRSWRTVDLPHDWSIEGPFSEQWASGTGYLPGGIAWYRKKLTVSSEQLSKQLYIYFDGVYKNSEVWINGHFLGKRPSGFTPFEYELTPYLNPGQDNVIAVRVDHHQFADSRYYTGSGIYRNVYLIEKSPVHIDLWGVAFTTPLVSEEHSRAEVSVQIKNSRAQEAEGELYVELLDEEGEVVASATKDWRVFDQQKGKTKVFLELAKPKLWSIDHPNLYTLKVSLFSKGEKIDDYSEKVGFRSFEFDAKKGFFLNGENLKLKGVCIHQDAGALGAAVPREVWARRLQKLKEVGCNAIRMSHYPHQDYLYELMDEMGFVVQDEAFDEWELGKNKWIEGWNVGTPGQDGSHQEFAEWGEIDLRDMILRNRNRPSIMMWSIGNEIDYPNDPYSHPVLNSGRNPQIYGRGYQENNPSADRLGVIAERLVRVVKQTDPTRPVTAALAGVVMSNETDYPGLLDIVGYNYQEYRYSEDHENYPTRIIYGSENGKGVDAWLAVDTNEFISSQFLWTGFDFLGEARSWPARSSGAGIMDLAGFEKPDFYFRQSIWTSKPMVFLSVSKLQPDETSGRPTGPMKPSWNWSHDELLRVRSFTNAEEVELFINGESQGKKQRLNAKQENLYWDVPFQAGQVLIKGYSAGKEVTAFQLKTAGDVSRIAATADLKTLTPSVRSTAHIEVALLDEAGTLVYDADYPIAFQVEGPAKLIGLESGDLFSHESYQAKSRKAYHGKVLAFIQSTGEQGQVRVTISSPGLPSTVVEFNQYSEN